MASQLHAVLCSTCMYLLIAINYMCFQFLNAQTAQSLEFLWAVALYASVPGALCYSPFACDDLLYLTVKVVQSSERSK